MRPTRRSSVFGDVLGLAELVDHEVASPLFDDFLDLGALMPPRTAKRTACD
jgi:hypothetical protein